MTKNWKLWWFWWIVLAVIGSGARAAIITKSIGSGKDYATVTAWEAATYGSATGTDQAVGEMYGTTSENPSIADTTPLSVTLQAAAGEEHDGTPDSGSGIVSASTASNVLTVGAMSGCVANIGGIEIDGNETNLANHIMQFSAADGEIRRCIIHSMNRNRAGNRAGLYLSSTGAIEILNNLICDLDNSGTGITDGIYGASDGTYKIMNNTVVDIDQSNVSGGAAYGIRLSNRTGYEVRNNLCYSITHSGGGSAYDYTLNIQPTHSHNISEDGTGDLTNKTITFVDSGTEDYHLDSSETDAIDQGSTDADVPSNDIDEDTRDASPDIGMDEVISAGIAIFYRLYRSRR